MFYNNRHRPTADKSSNVMQRMKRMHSTGETRSVHKWKALTASLLQIRNTNGKMY